VATLNSCQIKGSVTSAYQRDQDLSSALETLAKSLTTTLSDGTGDNQANMVWSDQRTLADAANEELDLSGSLSDIFGNSVQFTDVKLILIANLSTEASLKIGGAAANGFATMFGDATDILVLQPKTSNQNSFVLLTCPNGGFGVTAGTGDLLKLEHGGEGSTDLTYDIVLIGVSS